MPDSLVDYMQEGWEAQAAAELRARQGAGARYDSPNSPKQTLALARRGTAYFARKLNELSDEDLDEPSLLPGWTRRHLIAHIGYNARALARLVYWARTGNETPMYASPTQRDEQIMMGATLPARALRNLIDHSIIHLNVEWRDLSDEQWDHHVRTFQGREITARETAYMRAKEVWVHAVDLNNYGSFLDFPPEMIDGIWDDVLAAFEKRGVTPNLTLEQTDRRATAKLSSENSSNSAIVVRGTKADLTRWLTGRGGRRLESSVGSLPNLPSWF